MAKRKKRKPKIQPARFDEPLESDWEPKPPLETDWITEELLTRTQKVWSNYLGREVPPEEATEMLLNVYMIASTFHQVATEEAEERKREADDHEVPDADPLAGWNPEI